MILKRLVCLYVGLLFSAPVSAETFKFIAFGDAPYIKEPGEKDRVEKAFRGLIAAINKRRPDFVLHLGDTKSSDTACGKAHLEEQRGYMDSFSVPLIYTPGDNEWTDCHEKKAGGKNPFKQLRRIREIYFGRASSLGSNTIALHRQADLTPERADFVENARFLWKKVMVVTAHVVGSNNGFEVRDLETADEFLERDSANRAWLADSFEKAKERAKAIVVAMHADIFKLGFKVKKGKVTFPRHSGHKNIGEDLVKLAAGFDGPVLLVFGDSHEFKVFRPFPKHAPNILAVEVYGEDDINAAEITVDTDSGGAFSIGTVLPIPPAGK